MRSLRARVTLVTVAVAVIAVVVTGLISLQLVRSSTTDEARAQLSAQAALLSKLPRIADAAELADKASLALGGTEVALVKPDGTAEGPATQYLDALLLARIARGEPVSTARAGVMIETRPARGGSTIVLALPLENISPALGRATGRILIALAIGLLVAVVGGTLLARLLSRPLTATAAAARKLASGERAVSMPRNSTREVADVAEALAALDSALAASESRQREFLTSISHELRTPLTAVRGYAEAMSDGLVTPDRIRTVGDTLVAETERLDHFVGDLLELSRLEADDFSISPAAVDLPGLLADLVAAWSGRAATLGVTLTAHSSVDSVTTDPRRLRQVIDGLVENAMRVTPAGSTVSVEATAGAEAGSAIIEVLDGGPGLAAEDLAVAFERGVLRARYRDIRPVGTGLGLSIAARLVERLGGTISAANRPEGGAAFSVSLPGREGTGRLD
ncbi:HAMP domain-containing sensor histidine kinase [soil metagenome]